MKLRALAVTAILLLLSGVGIAFAKGSIEFGDSPTEDETLAEAQERLDPTNDPETVLHQTASGEWAAVQVFTARPLDEDILTVEDLAAHLSREEVEAGTIPDEAREERTMEIIGQYDCIAKGFASLPEDEAVPIDLIRKASAECIE